MEKNREESNTLEKDEKREPLQRDIQFNIVSLPSLSQNSMNGDTYLADHEVINIK